MDQMTFEFKLDIVGVDLPDFIDMLYKNGFENQAVKVQEQLDEQLENI